MKSLIHMSLIACITLLAACAGMNPRPADSSASAGEWRVRLDDHELTAVPWSPDTIGAP